MEIYRPFERFDFGGKAAAASPRAIRIRCSLRTGLRRSLGFSVARDTNPQRASRERSASEDRNTAHSGSRGRRPRVDSVEAGVHQSED